MRLFTVTVTVLATAVADWNACMLVPVLRNGQLATSTLDGPLQSGVSLGQLR